MAVKPEHRLEETDLSIRGQHPTEEGEPNETQSSDGSPHGTMAVMIEITKRTKRIQELLLPLWQQGRSARYTTKEFNSVFPHVKRAIELAREHNHLIDAGQGDVARMDCHALITACRTADFQLTALIGSVPSAQVKMRHLNRYRLQHPKDTARVGERLASLAVSDSPLSTKHFWVKFAEDFSGTLPRLSDFEKIAAALPRYSTGLQLLSDTIAATEPLTPVAVETALLRLWFWETISVMSALVLRECPLNNKAAWEGLYFITLEADTERLSLAIQLRDLLRRETTALALNSTTRLRLIVNAF